MGNRTSLRPRSRITLLALLLSAATLTTACWNPFAASGDVEYSVTGNGLVDISYETSNGRTEQVSGATLPWKYEFSEAEDGDFLYVSAKIVSNEGSITVEITKDGDLVERATALGLNGIATASGTY